MSHITIVKDSNWLQKCFLRFSKKIEIFVMELTINNQENGPVHWYYYTTKSLFVDKNQKEITVGEMTIRFHLHENSPLVGVVEFENSDHGSAIQQAFEKDKNWNLLMVRH